MFLERDKLLSENSILNKKIEKQSELINNYKQIDSLHVVKQEELNQQIAGLNKEIKTKSKYSMRNGLLIGGACGIAVTSLVFLLIR